MPMYDYRCRDCNAASEILVRNAYNFVKCLQCGSEAMDRLMSASYHINV